MLLLLPVETRRGGFQDTSTLWMATTGAFCGHFDSSSVQPLRYRDVLESKLACFPGQAPRLNLRAWRVDVDCRVIKARSLTTPSLRAPARRHVNKQIFRDHLYTNAKEKRD